MTCFTRFEREPFIEHVPDSIFSLFDVENNLDYSCFRVFLLLLGVILGGRSWRHGEIEVQTRADILR